MQEGQPTETSGRGGRSGFSELIKLVKVRESMKPCQSEGKSAHKGTPDKGTTGLKIQPSHFTSFKTPPKEEVDPVDSAEKDDSSEKFSMSKLCQAFIERCHGSQDRIFESKSLVEEFGVKQRRIYDLMNIMEGCGCLKKHSKGKYEWVGIQKSDFIQPESQKGDSTSLRQIAARIKLLMSESKGLIKFTDINELLIHENKDRMVNPASIRRRIYECCKVLRILGFIDKVGKHYQWVFNSEQPRARVQMPQARRETIKRVRRIQLTERQLLMEVHRRYTGNGALEQFIQKVKKYYEEAEQRVKKEEIIYQE